MYYKEIVDTLGNILSRYKGVNYVRYCGDDLINQQQNHKPIQCWIDNISLSDYNLTTNVNKMEFQIYILGFADGKEGNTTLDVQDICYTLAVNFLTYIDNMPQYQNLMNVYDWSILTLDRFTEQSNAGVKLSLVLNVVSPIDLCNFEEQFNEEPYTPEPDTPQIDIPTEEVGELEIKPIRLPRTKKC